MTKRKECRASLSVWADGKVTSVAPKPKPRSMPAAAVRRTCVFAMPRPLADQPAMRTGKRALMPILRINATAIFAGSGQKAA